jgi:hypothetical protein
MQPVKENSIGCCDCLNFVISVVGAHSLYWPQARRNLDMPLWLDINTILNSDLLKFRLSPNLSKRRYLHMSRIICTTLLFILLVRQLETLGTY